MSNAQLALLIIVGWLAISAALLTACWALEALEQLWGAWHSGPRRRPGSFTRRFSRASSTGNRAMVERVRTYTGCRPDGTWLAAMGGPVMHRQPSNYGAPGSYTSGTDATNRGGSMTAAADDLPPAA